MRRLDHPNICKLYETFEDVSDRSSFAATHACVPLSIAMCYAESRCCRHGVRRGEQQQQNAERQKQAKQAASSAANGKPAKKRKASAAADASNNTGDDVVERLELSDSDDE